MPDKLTVVADLLKVVIGEDPNRGGLIETPIRVTKAWQHWAGGYKEDPAEILKTFEDGAEDYNQIILVKDIPVYSHCEHHLSRVVDVFARRLQVQERLTSQVANAIQDALQPKAVGVIIECRHMCMESRGIQRQGASTVTSAMKGLFEWDRSAKEELLDLVRR